MQLRLRSHTAATHSAARPQPAKWQCTCQSSPVSLHLSLYCVELDILAGVSTSGAGHHDTTRVSITNGMKLQRGPFGLDLRPRLGGTLTPDQPLMSREFEPGGPLAPWCQRL